MPGRKRKPLTLRVLEGNPSKRPLPEGEPGTHKGDPGPPPWLDDAARAEWDRIVPHLVEMGVMQHADQTTLALLCDCIAAYVELKRARSPVSQRKPLLDVICRICSEYGLTPAARAKLAIVPDKAKKRDDPLAFARLKVK